MITIIFPFTPIPKGRPRFTRQGHAYTPDKTRKYEAELRLWASKFAPKKPLTGPLRIEVIFNLQKPKKPKSKFPITRPDIDNYFKCMDAFNGLLWVDDSQIVQVDMRKYYAMFDPSISFYIEEIGKN